MKKNSVKSVKKTKVKPKKVKKISSKSVKKTKVKPKKVKKLSSKSVNKTNDKDKPKKVKNIDRVSSGNFFFDKLTEGGFEKDSTNLIIGGSGSGKTIFGLQFLIEGIKKNENCLYVTFEEKKKEVYNNMRDLGWDLEEFEKKGKFHFLEYTPEKVKVMLEEGGGAIETLVIRKKISRIVMDSVTSFVLLFNDKIQRRKSILALFDMLRKWNITSILTYEGEPVKNKKVAPTFLEFESDSITLLYFLRDRKQRKRYLEILKMRGTNHSLNIYGFSIGKNGFNINKRPFTGNFG